jgi:hypothetical protein
MAAVSINTGDAYHEDRLAESPREKWPAILADRRLYLKTRVDHDCRCLVQYVAEAEEFYAELDYDSAEAMVLGAYGIKPEQAWAAVEYLQGRPAPELDKAVPMAQALSAAADHARAQPLAEHGQIGNGRADESRVDNVKSTDGGNSQAYLLRRLARDAPEVLDRVKAGEFKSARAAAIEAGIVKPVPIVRLTDPAKAAAKIRQHWNDEQITALCEALLR